MKWETAKKTDVIADWSDLFNLEDTCFEYPVLANRTYTAVIGECVSIPVDYLTDTVMTSMVIIDFSVASLLPFIIMMTCNTIIIKHLIKASIKVGSSIYIKN